MKIIKSNKFKNEIAYLHFFFLDEEKKYLKLMTSIKNIFIIIVKVVVKYICLGDTKGYETLNTQLLLLFN